MRARASTRPPSPLWPRQRKSIKRTTLSVGDGLNTGGFRFNAPTPSHLNSSYARFDFVPTHNQNLFVRLNVIDDHVTFAQWLPGTTSPVTWSHPSGIAFGHTWMISNNLVNNMRYGYTRQAFTSSGDSTGTTSASVSYFSRMANYHVSRVTPVHNITDDVSWTAWKAHLPVWNQFPRDQQRSRNLRQRL